MERSAKWPASLLVVLLVAACGLAEAAATDGKAAADAKKEEGKKGGQGRGKDVPRETPPEPAPEPAPAPVDSAPPVQDPPVAQPPTPAPAAEPVQPAPTEAPVFEEAPASAETPRPEVALPEEAAAPEAPPTGREPAPEVASLPFIQNPQESVAQGAAPLSPDAAGPSLLWGVPLVGLLLLGIVLSSARLVQPRPLPRPAPVASAAPASLLVAVKPRDLESLLRAAKAAVEAYRYEEAIAWFDQALRLDPRVAVAHYCRGVCLMGLQRNAEAYAAFRKAHELDPSEAAYRLELSRAAARMGRASEAMEVLGPLLQALPELVEDVASDPSFAGLLDHPRFLAMMGKL